MNSVVRGKRAFEWLLAPTKIPGFYSNNFEATPFHLSHGDSYFSSLFSFGEIKTLVEDGRLKHGRDLDVTSYTPQGGRLTLNGEYDTATNKETWNQFQTKGCSLRLLRPQQHSDSLWSLCSLLESYFQCMVGSNAYLTPSGTQGFAPHFDDIDAFVVQIHGSKRWRVYKPAMGGFDELPRTSSVDFTADDMKDKALALDVTLNPGDVLYMPRGAIHEARAVEDAPSLHITLSVHQKWTWADFLSSTIQDAISSAAANDISLRKTLPLRFADYVGQSKTDADDTRRDNFDKLIRAALKRVGKAYPIDAAADTMASRFMRERLPPPPSVVDHPKTGVKITAKSSVSAAGDSIARIIMGPDELPRIIHCMDNERATGTKNQLSELPCTPEEAGAIDFILSAYPHPVVVKEIPLDSEDDRVELVEGLVEMKIIKVL